MGDQSGHDVRMVWRKKKEMRTEGDWEGSSYGGGMASAWVGQRDLKRRDRWGRVLKDLVADRLP